MKFGVIVFPGSNCDADCFYVIKEVMKQEVKYIWHNDSIDNSYDCIVLPGGFSYGDYLRTGAIAKFSPIMKSVNKFAKNGKLIIGICNGFQILLECGLLPGAMMKNTSLQFICKEVLLRTDRYDTPFTNKSPYIVRIPIAHGEGNYYIDSDGLKRIEDNGQILFRYCDEKGDYTPESNPNGSIGNIAGILNEKGNILGMMPHPERSSEEELGSKDGKTIFDSIVNYLQ